MAIIEATYFQTSERIAQKLHAKGLSIVEAADLGQSLALLAHSSKLERKDGFNISRALLSAEILHEIADDYAREEEARRGEPLEFETGVESALPQVPTL